MHSLHYCPAFFRNSHAHRHVNAADDEYAFFRFDLACYVRGQPSVAGVDFERFQRSSEGPQHSTGGCGDHIVNC